MRFTKEQYEKAIKDLQDGMTQLEPNGHGCHICGDSGHQAFECGHNPLVAMAICNFAKYRAQDLHDKMHGMQTFSGDLIDQTHEFMHWLTGFDFYMGTQLGLQGCRSRRMRSGASSARAAGTSLPCTRKASASGTIAIKAASVSVPQRTPTANTGKIPMIHM